MAACFTVMLFGGKSFAKPSGETPLPSPYDWLKGEVKFYVRDDNTKFALGTARTKTAVTRIRVKLEVHYTRGGAYLWSEESGWISQSRAAAAEVDTYNVPNAQNNNLRDGFIGTSLTAYSTADAIITNAYAVYTSTTG